MIKSLRNLLDPNNDKSDASLTMLSLLVFFPFISLLIILSLTLNYPLKSVPFVVANTLTIIFSISIVGFLIGFIFGIPRSIRFRFDKTKNRFENVDDNESDLADNTNLEEISDWLTKIIVGLTLIEGRTIIRYLEKSAHSIADSYPKTGIDLFVFSHALIVFFLGYGFFGGYFWARTKFGSILIQSKNEEQDKLRSRLNRYLPTDNIPILSSLKEKICHLLTVTPVIHPDDTQKERWGGKSVLVSEGRELKVTVNPLLLGLFDVIIEVVSTSPDNPLDDIVVILLDSTFQKDNATEIYLTPVNNKVKVSVAAREAFTVAAICDDLKTKLELDLQKLKGLPPKFYYKE
jgi:hypothetical protein